jgi:transposase
VLIEAAKLAPRWNPQLAKLHTKQLELGHPNRATLQVARKLVAYLLAVDKSGRPFQMATPPLPLPGPAKGKRRKRAALAKAA